MSKKRRPKYRNPIVVAMMARSQKGGAHLDRKKEEQKRGCRDWQGEE